MNALTTLGRIGETNMRHKIITAFLALTCLFTTYAWPQSIKPTVISQKVSLTSDNATINYIELTNTHSRTYEDYTYRFTLTEGEGVLWKIQCVGVKMEKPFDKIILRNEKGQIFKPASNWLMTAENSKGYDKSGRVIYDGPLTTFLLVGDDNSKTIQIMFGDASVNVEVK